MHSFRSDPDMRIGQIGARRIPCACNGCLEKLDSVWKTVTIDQEEGRLNTIDRYEMKAIFDDLNDWQAVKLESSKNNDTNKGDLAKKILHGIESRTSEDIMKGNYEAMRTYDLDKDEYYIVEWDFNVNAAQDDIVMKGYNPPEYVYAGEMVYMARF